MRRFLHILAAIGLLLAGGALAADAQDQPRPDPTEAISTIQTAVASAQAGDTEGALAKIRPLVEGQGFDRYDPLVQFAGLASYSAILLASGDNERALDVARRTLAANLRPLEANLLMLQVSQRAGAPLETARALAAIARLDAARVSTFEDDFIYQTINLAQMTEGGMPLYYDLLAALHDANWKPKSPFGDAEALWLRLAAHLIDIGEDARGANLASTITAPYQLMRMMADRRFDAVVAANPNRFNHVERALTERLRTIRAAAAAHPDSLEGVTDVASMLMALGRAREALSVLDSAIARNRAGHGFDDEETYLSWTFNQRGYALRQVGRFDDAAEALRQGAAQLERGHPNVSQVLNYAVFLVSLNRAQDALQVLRGVPADSQSPYGIMVQKGVEACAAAELGDQAMLTQAREYIEAHSENGPTLARHVAICANDLDRAAALVIQDLQDVDRRSDMLFDLQIYMDEAHPTPQGIVNGARWENVIARPDVQAALAAVGHRRRIPVVE